MTDKQQVLKDALAFLNKADQAISKGFEALGKVTDIIDTVAIKIEDQLMVEEEKGHAAEQRQAQPAKYPTNPVRQAKVDAMIRYVREQMRRSEVDNLGIWTDPSLLSDETVDWFYGVFITGDRKAHPVPEHVNDSLRNLGY